MIDGRKFQQEEAPASPLRHERSTAALMAQYIHDLSRRHAVASEGSGRGDHDESAR